MTTSKIFFFFHLFISHIVTTMCAQTSCPQTRCPGSDIPIRFPFGLKDRIDQRCGYNSSFDLSCNDQNQIIITLPSGEFTVNSFDYEFGELSINDQRSCLARRLLATNFTVDPPFRFPYSLGPRNYTFLNCTPTVTNIPYVSDMLVPVTCLSGQNYSIVAVLTDLYPSVKQALAPYCSLVSEALVPVVDIDGDVTLSWDLLACRSCEFMGRACGFAGDTGNDVGCSPSFQPNLPHSNKAGWAIVAVVVPVILLVFWFMFYCTFKARPQQTRTHQYSVSLGVTGNNNSDGLDRTTLESYPKTVLLELQDPNNNTCSICLSEYKLGETIRTIPNCQHYFHVNCIYEWLQKSKTCPLCRNFASSSVDPSNLPSLVQP